MLLRRRAQFRALLADRRTLLLLTVAAVVITFNWATYIWGVNNGRVVETSLGYFINPLVTVLMGVFILASGCGGCSGWRMAIAGLAVVVLTVDYGRLPWVALMLAFSFGTYGLSKKTASVGRRREPDARDAAASRRSRAAYIVWLVGRDGRLRRATAPATRCCSPSTGIVTAIPLLCFGAAAIRVSMVTLGLLQYLAPILQFALGVVWFHEDMPASRWTGFAWCGSRSWCSPRGRHPPAPAAPAGRGGARDLPSRAREP